MDTLHLSNICHIEYSWIFCIHHTTPSKFISLAKVHCLNALGLYTCGWNIFNRKTIGIAIFTYHQNLLIPISDKSMNHLCILTQIHRSHNFIVALYLPVIDWSLLDLTSRTYCHNPCIRIKALDENCILNLIFTIDTHNFI